MSGVIRVLYMGQDTCGHDTNRLSVIHTELHWWAGASRLRLTENKVWTPLLLTRCLRRPVTCFAIIRLITLLQSPAPHQAAQIAAIIAATQCNIATTNVWLQCCCPGPYHKGHLKFTCSRSKYHIAAILPCTPHAQFKAYTTFKSKETSSKVAWQ